MSNALSAIEAGLVVSVQAPRGGPLDDPSHVAAIAAAVSESGASGIRAEGGADIAAVKAAVGVPVIGLRKRDLDDSPVRITPTLADAHEVVAAGADVLAVDATLRPGPGGQPRSEFLEELRTLRQPVLADVDSLAAGVAAREAGAAAVATTLSGYTRGPRRRSPTWSWWPSSSPSSTARCSPRAATPPPRPCRPRSMPAPSRLSSGPRSRTRRRSRRASPPPPRASELDGAAR